jgi:hypothetical protein
MIYHFKNIMKVMLVILALVSFCCAQYSEPFAEELCKLAISSYCKPSQVLSWNCHMCMNSQLGIKNVSLIINSSSSTLGFIAISQTLSSIGKK